LARLFRHAAGFTATDVATIATTTSHAIALAVTTKATADHVTPIATLDTDTVRAHGCAAAFANTHVAASCQHASVVIRRDRRH